MWDAMGPPCDIDEVIRLIGKVSSLCPRPIISHRSDALSAPASPLPRLSLRVFFASRPSACVSVVRAAQAPTSRTMMQGADPNHHDGKSGNTPLLEMVHFGRFEGVRELVKHGANVNLANYGGTRPMHVAAYCGASNAEEGDEAGLKKKVCLSVNPSILLLPSASLHLCRPALSPRCLVVEKAWGGRTCKNGSCVNRHVNSRAL
jgi:hypothetical protein